MLILKLTCNKKFCCKILAGKERENELENCSLVKKRASNCLLIYNSFKILLMLHLGSKLAAVQLQGKNSTIITEVTWVNSLQFLTMLHSISERINHK